MRTASEQQRVREILARYVERHPPQFLAAWSVTAPRACPFHSHETFEAVYHVRGRGTTRADSTVHFDVGWAVLYPVGMSHDQVLETPGEDICVHWELDGPVPAILQRTLAVAPSLDAEIGPEFIELAHEAGRSGQLLRIYQQHRGLALFVRLIHDAVAATAVRQDRHGVADHAELAYRFITKHFREASRCELVADHVGVTPDYLRHLFKRRYRITLKQMVHRIRIAHAKRLLAYSPLPQKAIAAECGFGNDRHFSVSFRAAVGVTPGTYRSQSRCIRR